jgi:hypothetical protein
LGLKPRPPKERSEAKRPATVGGRYTAILCG